MVIPLKRAVRESRYRVPSEELAERILGRLLEDDPGLG